MTTTRTSGMTTTRTSGMTTTRAAGMTSKAAGSIDAGHVLYLAQHALDRVGAGHLQREAHEGVRAARQGVHGGDVDALARDRLRDVAKQSLAVQRNHLEVRGERRVAGLAPVRGHEPLALVEPERGDVRTILAM